MKTRVTKLNHKVLLIKYTNLIKSCQDQYVVLYSMPFKLTHLLYNKTYSLKVRFRKCDERKFNNFKFDKIFGNLLMKEDARCHN